MRPIFRFLIPLCRLAQLALFSVLWLSDFRYVISRSESHLKAVAVGSFIPEFLPMTSLPIVFEADSTVLAVTGVVLELVIMALKRSCGQTNGVWSLFFGAIGTAITADVFADHSSNENEQDRKRYLQLFFESAVVFACLADLIATIKLLGAEDDERPKATSSPSGFYYVTDPLRGRNNSLLNTTTSTTSSYKNGHVNGHIAESPSKKRQRRDSASPGRVGYMLSTLSLGGSECEPYQRPISTSGFTSVLAPARFQPPSPQSSSFSRQNANSSFNEQAYLWPSRFPTSSKKTGFGDSDDCVSVFSSVSQQYYRNRPVAKEECSKCSHSATTSPGKTDWFWKGLISLVMLCSFSTNAVVLYYLLIRG